MKRKMMALLVAAMMLASMLPMAALAEDGGQALAHQGHYECTHQCGDGSCSFVEAVEGREGVAGAPCDFICNEELEEGQACTCGHTCGDGSCGYQEAVEPVEAVEGVACDHDCAASGCTWVCDDDCPACAAEQEEPKPEAGEIPQPEANGGLSAAPALLGLGTEANESPAYLAITDWDDLDPWMNEERQMDLTDGQTLDLSAMGDNRSAGGREFFIHGDVTVIGQTQNTYSFSSLYFHLAEGSHLTLNNVRILTTKYFACISVDDGVENASITVEGVNKFNGSKLGGISAPDGCNLFISGDGTLEVNSLLAPSVKVDSIEFTADSLKNSTAEFENAVVTGSTFSGDLTFTNCDVTLEGGNPCLSGTTTINGGTVSAKGANFKPGVTGEVYLNSGSLVAGTFSNSMEPSPAVKDAALHITPGATFAAFSGNGVPAIDPDTVALNGTPIVSGRLKKDQAATLFRIGNGPVTAPFTEYDRSFAVAVEAEGAYTIAHPYGLSHLELPDGTSELQTGVENLELAWVDSDLSNIGDLRMEAGNIVINENSIQYGPAAIPADLSQPVAITQEDPAKPTTNNIVIADGVTATVELRNVNLNISSIMRKAPISVGANAHLTLILPEGTSSTLACGYGTAGIELKDGSSLFITGAGSLWAEALDGDAAGIGVVAKSAGYYPVSTYPTVTIGGDVTVTAKGNHGAGIGSANSSDSFDSCKVVIEGNANVYAEGGNGAAGIGGGLYGSGTSTVIRDNANVTAVSGGGGAAAIGGGQGNNVNGKGGHAGQITITGNATVTAISLGGGAGIGRGLDNDNDFVAPNEGDAILIDTTGAITAYAMGNTQPTLDDGKYHFAIDAGISTTVSVPILNARFVNQFPGASKPVDINVIRREDNKKIALTLPSGYSTCHAFATTVELLDGKNTAFMVQDGRSGNECQFADFGKEPNAEGDAPFLYTVGDTMTTRDDLFFKSFVIEATTDGNGTITASGGAPAEGKIQVAPLSTTTFYFQGNDGYVLDTVSVDGHVEAVTGNSYTFKDVAQDGAIHVTFKKAAPSIVTHTITATAGSNGAITPAGDSTVEAGKNASFSFAPNSGYVVDVVTVDGEAVRVTSNGYTFENVQADHTIHVTFRYAGGNDDDDDDDDDDYVPPTVDIDDPEIPLVQPELPVENEEIPDPEIPLANLPEEPTEDVPEEKIEEHDTPLANLPKTGGMAGPGMGLVGIGALLAGMVLRKKEK